MTQQLATQGERHERCGRMVAYGELHWIDECTPKAQKAVCNHCGRTFTAINREYGYIEATIGRRAAEDFEATHESADED